MIRFVLLFPWLVFVAPIAFGQDLRKDGQARKYVHKHKIGYFDRGPEMRWADITDKNGAIHGTEVPVKYFQSQDEACR